MGTFKKGDRVIQWRLVTREEMENHGGWTPSINNAIKQEGTVTYVTSNGAIDVDFGSMAYRYNPIAFRLVSDEANKEKEMDAKQLYIKLQSQLDFKEGDTVELTGIFSDNQFGYNGNYDSDLEDKIGEEAEIITKGDQNDGYELRFFDDYENDSDCCTYWVPFFAIAKVAKASRLVVKISDDYNAIISSGGIVVGCQTIEYDDFDKLVKAVDKIRNGK